MSYSFLDLNPAKGSEKLVVEGKGFADELFSVRLGANPEQDDLKREWLKS